MLRILNKYLDKLEVQGIAGRKDAIFLAVDAEMFSNKPMDGDILVFEARFDLMNIGSFCSLPLREP